MNDKLPVQKPTWKRSEVFSFRRVGYRPRLVEENGEMVVRYFAMNGLGHALDRTDMIKELFGEYFTEIDYKIKSELELIQAIGEGSFENKFSDA